jgi:hypothetical protein
MLLMVPEVVWFVSSWRSIGPHLVFTLKRTGAVVSPSLLCLSSNVRYRIRCLYGAKIERVPKEACELFLFGAVAKMRFYPRSLHRLELFLPTDPRHDVETLPQDS